MWMQACGHDSFCFKCISGLEKCPLCSKEIVGWVALPQKSNARQSLISSTSAVANDADLEESDDEDSRGLVHWSSEDVFSQGGVRTMIGTENNGGDLSEEPACKERPQEDSPQEEGLEVVDKIEVQALEPEKTFTRRVAKTVPMEEFMVGDAENKSTKPATALSKKRGRLSLDVETLNHTRLMERPLTEILVQGPLVVEPVRKARGKKGQPASTSCVGKRSRGNQGRLTVPAKFRD